MALTGKVQSGSDMSTGAADSMRISWIESVYRLFAFFNIALKIRFNFL